MKLTHQDYYKIAIPFILSTVTQPLLGAVDTAVIGKLGAAELIGGVAIGTVIMNTLYWLFGFFRVSTTGQSAMALGKGDHTELVNSLLRPCVLALLVGLIFIVMQVPLWQGALWIIAPESAVAHSAQLYFDIMIFGAPFVLLNYTLIGWLMGQAKAKETLMTQVAGNVLNIILDVIFVLYFDWGIEGVAVATLIAQVSTFALALCVVFRSTSFSWLQYVPNFSLSRENLNDIVSSNFDLLLRTVCILVFFNMMARVGSQLGAEVLATNAIVMQITFIISYLFDGIANASSVFAGKAIGQKNPALLDSVIRLNVQWTTGFVVILTLLVWCGQSSLVRLFTHIPNIIAMYSTVSVWLLIFPLAAGYGLTFYGIFTGTGTTRPVRNSSVCTLVIFLIVQLAAVEWWGNTGLWFSFTLFYVGRFIFLYPYLKEIESKCRA